MNVALLRKLVVLLPRVVILLKRIHHIQLTSRETGDSRNQMDEKDSQITHHTIPTSAKSTKCPQIRNSPATRLSRHHKYLRAGRSRNESESHRSL